MHTHTFTAIKPHKNYQHTLEIFKFALDTCEVSQAKANKQIEQQTDRQTDKQSESVKETNNKHTYAESEFVSFAWNLNGFRLCNTS